MLGLAAAVFGLPFAVGAGVPVAGALARGGLKTIGRMGAGILAGRTRPIAFATAGLGYGVTQFASSEALSDTYTSIYGPGRNTQNVLSTIKIAGNVAGGTAMVLGGLTGILGRMPGLPKRTMTKGMKMSIGAAGATMGATAKLGGVVSKHPFMASFAIGGVLGAGAAAITGSTRFKNVEGNIIAMRSSASGGMSPELQFSTNGLVFALHKNRKRVF